MSSPTLTGHIGTMGQDLGTLYDALWQEIVWIHRKWKEYRVLYRAKKERVDLLNRAAPSFFRIVQDTLLDDTLLSLSRITDPPEMGKNKDKTVSLKALPGLITDATTRATVQALVDDAMKAVAVARKHRNKRIAHLDYAVITGHGKATQLPDLLLRDVDQALDAVGKVLNAISGHYEGKTLLFDMMGPIEGAEDLLYVIHYGLEAQAARNARRRNGSDDPDDWKVPDV